MAKLIVIEGVDASGKETQTGLLCSRLEQEGKKVVRLSFPDYESTSSALVKMYLGGEIGDDPEAVSPYAASLFYAADRYISFKTKWSKLMDQDVYIIADRYVTSNIIYQGAKLCADERDAFTDWLCDIEYGALGLPVPDKVLFLNMEPEAAAVLMAGRNNKITGDSKKDIHDKDADYLRQVYINACEVAKRLGWTEIKCSVNSRPRSIEEIAGDIAESIL